jgi:hypothetical protein
MLNVLDGPTCECQSITISRKLRSSDVIDILPDQSILRGEQEHQRSAGDLEPVLKTVRQWTTAVRTKHA